MNMSRLPGHKLCHFGAAVGRHVFILDNALVKLMK